MQAIAVTGGLGFIGSHFIELLLSQTDATIHCLDKETYAADLKFKESLSNNTRVHFHKIDISKKEDIIAVEPLIKDCTHVVHFAAESHVDNSIHGPESFVLTNVIGTFNMLEFAKRNSTKRFVHVSTDEVYGAIESMDHVAEQIFRETTLLDPSSVYSSTKAASDLIVKSYYKTYKLDVCITRCCNNYGPRQNKEKLLPKVILNALSDVSIPVYGEGKNIREWIHVTDHCKGILKVLKEGTTGEIYNIGSGTIINNIDLVKLVLQKLNKPHSLITFVEDRKGHDFMYMINSDKIQNALNWQAEFNFENGLDVTIDYYRSIV